MTTAKTEIGKNRLSLLNRRSKQYAKHLDVNLSVDGIAIHSSFERFSAYELDQVAFTIIETEGVKHKFNFTYDFITGNLTCINRKEHIEIADLFSNRHLQSLLFFAREFAFLESDDIDLLTRRIHEKIAVPEMWTESSLSPLRKKLKVDRILVCDDRKIIVDGVLSMSNYDTFWLPFYAKCTFTLNRFGDTLFTWRYLVDGKITTVEEREFSGHGTLIMPSTISYEKTRLHIQGTADKTPQQQLDAELARITQGKSFILYSAKPGRMGLTDLKECVLYGIYSINDQELNFLVCDGGTASKVLTYNKDAKKIFISERRGSKLVNKREYVFSPKGNKALFDKVVNHWQ